MIASQCLGRWLKEHPHDNQVHRVLRYDRDMLISYCGRAIPITEALMPQGGVLCCPACAGLSRQREDAKRREWRTRADNRSLN